MRKLLYFIIFFLMCFINLAFADECEHEFEWYGNETEHWNMCSKCGYQDPYARGRHWRMCDEDQCAVCGLPYYDDDYYMEHSGEVVSAYYVDETRCCQVWGCCGLNQIVEHSYPDFGENFEVVDEHYHSYECAVCHSRVVGEHSFSEEGECYDCGYVLSKESQIPEISSNPEDESSLHPGDMICFGTYEQDGDPSNGPEPIEWMVLDTDGSKYLLLSVYLLDCVEFYPGHEPVIWEESKIRNLLNDEFISIAFTGKELSSILVTEVENGPGQGNSEYRTIRGSVTRDRVFLLSYAEAKKYFGAEMFEKTEAALAECTPYMKQVNGKISESTPSGMVEIPYRDWWLRSTYEEQRSALTINQRGVMTYDSVSKKHFIRPAVWVDLSVSIAKEGPEIGRDSLLRESSVIKGRSFKIKRDAFVAFFWNKIEEKEPLAGYDYVDSSWKIIDKAEDNTDDLWSEGITLYQRDYEMYMNFNHGTAFSIKALTDDEDYITRVIYVSPESLFYQTVLGKLDYSEQLQKFTVRYPASVLSALTNETLETSESVINKLLDGTVSGNLSKDEQGNYYVIHNSVKCSLTHRTNGGTEYTFSVAYEMDSLHNNTSQTQDETELEEVNPILFIAKTKKATNIREKADKKSNKIATINQKGKEVSVVEIVTGDDGMTWYKISLEDGTEGYARSDFFTR